MMEFNNGQFKTISREVQATEESPVTSEVCPFGDVVLIPTVYLVLVSCISRSHSHLGAVAVTNKSKCVEGLLNS